MSSENNNENETKLNDDQHSMGSQEETNEQDQIYDKYKDLVRIRIDFNCYLVIDLFFYLSSYILAACTNKNTRNAKVF